SLLNCSDLLPSFNSFEISRFNMSNIEYPFKNSMGLAFNIEWYVKLILTSIFLIVSFNDLPLFILSIFALEAFTRSDIPFDVGLYGVVLTCFMLLSIKNRSNLFETYCLPKSDRKLSGFGYFSILFLYF
ncbi:hypothetical protein DMUE_5253, partial [Dictyocoela muelleri]